MTELPTKKIGEQVPLGSLVSEFEILHGRKAAFWRAIGKIDAMDPEMRQHHRENFYIASKVAALSEAGIKRGRPYFGAVMTAYHIIKEELAESNHPVFDAQSIKRWKNDNPLNQECTRIPGAAHVLHRVDGNTSSPASKPGSSKAGPTGASAQS